MVVENDLHSKIYPRAYLSPSSHPFYQSACFFICMSARLHVYLLSICLCAYPSFRPSVCLSICHPVYSSTFKRPVCFVDVSRKQLTNAVRWIDKSIIEQLLSQIQDIDLMRQRSGLFLHAQEYLCLGWCAFLFLLTTQNPRRHRRWHSRMSRFPLRNEYHFRC